MTHVSPAMVASINEVKNYEICYRRRFAGMPTETVLEMDGRTMGEAVIKVIKLFGIRKGCFKVRKLKPL